MKFRSALIFHTDTPVLGWENVLGKYETKKNSAAENLSRIVALHQ